MITSRGRQTGRDKGRGVCVTRALQRKALVVQYSEQGLTREETAERVGVTEHGVRAITRRYFNTQRWPIPGHEPNA